MITRFSKGAAGSLAAACVVFLAGSLARAQDFQKWFGGVQAGPHVVWAQATDDDATPIELGDHWIGVLCQPADDLLTKHLRLDHGLVVDQVVPDAPAEKAGIQQHDILLSMGGKPLKEIVDLVEAVKEAKDKETDVKLIRAGKEQAVKVTPAKRADDAFQLPPGVMTPQEAFKKWREALPQGQEAAPFRWHRFRPGIVLPENVQEKLEIPEDLSISISKQGGEKATITVKRSDQIWNTTEDKLEALPDDVRPHVERVLGRGAGIKLEGVEIELDALKSLPDEIAKQLPQLKQPWKLAPMPQIRVYRGKPGEQAQPIEKRMREQLKQMQRSLDEMHRQLEQAQQIEIRMREQLKQMQRSLDEMHRQLDSLQAQPPADADRDPADADKDVDVEIEVVPEKAKN